MNELTELTELTEDQLIALLTEALDRAIENQRKAVALENRAENHFTAANRWRDVARMYDDQLKQRKMPATPDELLSTIPNLSQLLQELTQ